MPRRPEVGSGGAGRGGRRRRASASDGVLPAQAPAVGKSQSWRKRPDAAVAPARKGSPPRAAARGGQRAAPGGAGADAAAGAPDAGAAAGGAPLQPPVAAHVQAPPVQAAAVAQQLLPAEDPGHSGEAFLMEMLAAMDQHMQQLRKTQQGLVAIIELACRRALGGHFGRLMLVGSAALRVETPGSDIDVVCFTRRDVPRAAGLPAELLRRVDWALRGLAGQHPECAAGLSVELIEDARVPILRVLWGPAEGSAAVDVSVDQHRPVDHVRWFQRVGAAPRLAAPPPAVAPLVTLTLRCVKWWLRQRQLPRTKEGGLPTLAWLLMVVHVCSLPETHERAAAGGPRPMAALLESLAAFFRHFAALRRLDGTLQFSADGASSAFRPHAEGRAAPWAELVVLDPTREGPESLNLVPRLPPATQLLLCYELRRASLRLEAAPRGREATQGQGRRALDSVFEPPPDGVNVMPSSPPAGGLGVLVLSPGGAGGAGGVDFGLVASVAPRAGWAAPFLHRGDERTELCVRLCDVEEASGRCWPRGAEARDATLSPCRVVCRAHAEREGRGWRLGAEAAERLRAMRELLRGLEAPGGAGAKAAAAPPAEAPEPRPAAQSLGLIPSPARSCAALL